MLPAEVKVGFVFRYSYLWHRERLEGREEEVKDRPCLVLALVVNDVDGNKQVGVLPITHSPPEVASMAIELPSPIKLRLGLDDAPSWIILSESNYFAWPGPDIRPSETENGYLGPLPPSLFNEVKYRFVALARQSAHRSVARTE
ncbi:hypothetical protein RHSP_32530 [Rhizobium freirei PRF 81]|uniref:Plasmid maintenance toxin (PemK-like) n=1 Tax=Rhizobium freirei PRF 81 TaxID=363754 RepID=N6U790_9HYPH|nr:hypothetical protein [Rhizobium freirei]ENN86113.1 hypothetical protein RHSP_32530 [Rhizobium freirei PRF 81]